jgi:hypothetical protein
MGMAAVLDRNNKAHAKTIFMAQKGKQFAPGFTMMKPLIRPIHMPTKEL